MTEDELIASLAKSKTLAKRLARKATASQVERAISNLQLALADARKRDQERENKRKAASLKKLSAMMAEMGLSADDIANIAGSPKRGKSKVAKKSRPGPKSGNKVAAKYQITHNGSVIKWTGRGRMPVAFREFVEQGGSLDQCLI